MAHKLNVLVCDLENNMLESAKHVCNLISSRNSILVNNGGVRKLQGRAYDRKRNQKAIR